MSDAAIMEAAASVDLVDTVQDQQVFDPGMLDQPGELVETDRDLTIEQAAADLVDDDDHRKGDEKPVIYRDGQPITLSQLVEGYALSNVLLHAVGDLQAKYAKVAAVAESTVAAASGLAAFLEARLSPEPDPRLAQVRPIEYAQQKAAFDHAQKDLLEVIAAAQQTARYAAQQAADALAQRAGVMVEIEKRRFTEHFPQSADPAWLKQFFEGIKHVAHECDFSDAELRSVIDSRQLRVLHLAALGMEKQSATSQRQLAQRSRKKAEQPRSAAPPDDGHYSIDDAMRADFD